MLCRQFQAEAPGIELSKTGTEGNEQIAFEQNLLDGAEPRNTARRERVIGRDQAFAAGGGEDRRLQQLSQLLNGCASLARAVAEQENRLSRGGNLLSGLNDLLRRRSSRPPGQHRHCRLKPVDGSEKEIVRDFDENRSRYRTVKLQRGLGKCGSQLVGSGDAPGKPRERLDDLKLIRRLMQRSASLAEQG